MAMENGGASHNTHTEGPAFTLLIKVMSTILMLALVVWGGDVVGEAGWRDWSTGSALILGSALLISLVVYVWILKSRTSINAECIEQTWLWKKRVLISEISQAKFIYVPHLSWLIAPRLIVRAGPGVRVFYAASPDVIRAFSSLMLGK